MISVKSRQKSHVEGYIPVLSALCPLEKICLTVPKLQTSSVSNNKSHLASDYVPGNDAKPFRLIASQQLQERIATISIAPS